MIAASGYLWFVFVCLVGLKKYAAHTLLRSDGPPEAPLGSGAQGLDVVDKRRNRGVTDGRFFRRAGGPQE